MKNLSTSLLLVASLFIAFHSNAQSAAVKAALAKLDEDQQLVVQKVTATTGCSRVNTVYYGSFLLQTVSSVRNSINALPSGRKVALTPAQKSALEQLNDVAGKFSKSTSPFNDSIELASKAIIGQLEANVPLPGLIKALLIRTGNQGPFQVKVDGDFIGPLYDTTVIQISKAKPKRISTAAMSFYLNDEQMGMTVPKEPFDWHRYTLTIPYVVYTGKKKKKDIKVAEFEFLGCTFPNKPGKVEVTSSKSNGGDVQHKRTRTFLVNSTRENLVEKQCVPKADNGFTVLPESIKLEIESSKGKQSRDWNYKKTESGGNVCFVVETFYNKGGESGKLEFYIKYDVKRTATSDNDAVTQSYDLDWGSTKEITASGPRPTLVYTDYKGEQIALDKDNVQPYMPTVKVTDRKITITMPGIDQLVKPTATNP